MRVISKRGRAFNAYPGSRASGYELAREDRPQWRIESRAVESILADVRGRVLDCPVGTGRFLALYDRLGLECVGVDVDPFMLSEARGKETKATLVRRDGRDTGQDSRSFDAVICVRLFEHCTRKDALALLKEFRRVLKPNGLLIVSVQIGKPGLPEDFWRRSIAALKFEPIKAVRLFKRKTRRRSLVVLKRNLR